MSIQTLAILSIVVVIINSISLGMIFNKAKQPLSSAFVPGLDAITLQKITGTTAYASLFIFTLFNPVIFILIITTLLAIGSSFTLGLVLSIYLIFSIFVLMGLWTELASDFGQDPLFGLATSFLPFIFLPMLAFGPAKYVQWRTSVTA